MEENNNLREKVRLLEAEKLTNKPELSFIINGHDNALGALNIVLPELDSEVFSYDSVRPLTHNDIPFELRRYVNEADLVVYNEQLPEDSEVETYLDSMQFYLFAKIIYQCSPSVIHPLQKLTMLVFVSIYPMD